MTTIRIALLVLTAILASPAFSEAALVISEIMANPSGSGPGAKDDVASNSDEWFEVYNSNSTSADLSTVKFDNDADASDGVALSGMLHSGQHVIIGNRSIAAWTARYGTLSPSTTYLNVSPWQILANPGGTLSLYSSVTNSTFFSLNYGTTVDGTSLVFTGTSTNSVSPYVFGAGSWQNATTLGNGGNQTDLHSAGSSSLQAAPEPASFALLALAGLGLILTVRRNRRELHLAQSA